MSAPCCSIAASVSAWWSARLCLVFEPRALRLASSDAKLSKAGRYSKVMYSSLDIIGATLMRS